MSNPENRRSVEVTERTALHSAFAAAARIHTMGESTIENAGLYPSSRIGKNRLRLRPALEISASEKPGDPLSQTILITRNARKGEQTIGISMSPDGIRKSFFKLYDEPDFDAYKARADLDREDALFQRSAGLDLMSDAEVLANIRELRGIMGREWPADVELPDNEGSKSLPTPETISLFQTVTSELASQRQTTQTTWYDGGKQYLLTTIEEKGKGPVEVVLTQLERDLDSTSDEKVVHTWEFLGKKNRFSSISGEWEDDLASTSSIEGDEYHIQEEMREKQGLFRGVFGVDKFKASEAEVQLGLTILERRAQEADQALQQAFDAMSEPIPEREEGDPNPGGTPTIVFEASDETLEGKNGDIDWNGEDDPEGPQKSL